MPTVLITAFEPYDQWKSNSSWLALLEFTKNMPEVPKIVTRRYPVDFSQVQQRLEQDMQQNFDVALHLGQAPGSARIRLEAIGLNIGGGTNQLPDEFRPLVSEGPTAYQSNLPLATWATRLRHASIPAAVSYHAGTYLCNALLYLSLHIAKTRGFRTRSTFIHLPLAPEQVASEQKDMPTMSPESSAKALRLLLEEILQRRENERTLACAAKSVG
jgi:pyroglutamyl-peptidase